MNNFTTNVMGAALNTAVLDWAYRVQKNGGALPSQRTILAANVFYNGLVYTGLLPLMKSVSIFAPDSLTACLTPLINSGSSSADPWVNSTFVAGDLSISGLQGNGSTKFVDTNFSCSKFDSTGSAGLTCYNTLGSNASNGDMGIWFASGNLLGAYIGYTGTTFWDCWNSAGGRISAANSLWAGYISFNRTNAASSAVYKASSTVAHTTLVSSTTETATGGFPAPTIWMLGQNSNYKSSRRFSFGAIHAGLTLAQSSTFYTLIQNLRVNIGGGYA